MIPATLLALLLPLSAQAGWVDDAAAARAACAADPTPCDVVDSLRIRESRAGSWFVQDERLTVDMVPHLLDRLQREQEPQLRRALTHGITALIPHDDPTWHAAWIDLAANDPDPGVRSTAIMTLRRAPRSLAEPGLRKALQHFDPETRARAADAIGGHADAAVFVDALAAALNDDDLGVRREVVGALGKTRSPAARPLVEALDPAGDDVLAKERLRALERLSGS